MISKILAYVSAVLMCIFFLFTVFLPTAKAIAVKPKQTPKATFTPSPGIVLLLVIN